MGVDGIQQAELTFSDEVFKNYNRDPICSPSIPQYVNLSMSTPLRPQPMQILPST